MHLSWHAVTRFGVVATLAVVLSSVAGCGQRFDAGDTLPLPAPDDDVTLLEAYGTGPVMTDEVTTVVETTDAVPPDWPADVPIHDGGVVTEVERRTDARTGDRGISVRANVTEGGTEVFAEMIPALEAAGFSDFSESVQSRRGTHVWTLTARRDATSYGISVQVRAGVGTMTTSVVIRNPG